MESRKDAAGELAQQEALERCFHSIGLIDQNREYLQMHLQPTEDDPALQALRDIQVETARLERTLHNTVTLLQLQQTPLATGWVDLCSLLEKAARLAPEIRSQLQIELTTDSGGVAHWVAKAEPDEVQQMLLHLISNALRASDAGGRVWVTLRQQQTGVVLRVEDEGCGPAPGAENHRRFLGGAGLGLQVCHAVCRRAGWQLTLTHRPGGGTRAQVVIPCAGQSIPPQLELGSGGVQDDLFFSRAARELLLLRPLDAQ